MDPFPRRWKRLDRHDAGCTALGADYVPPSNFNMPSYDHVKGCVVVVAGKPGSGGKSVLSHRFLHCYENLPNVKLYGIDLADMRDNPADDDRHWLCNAVKKAYLVVNLISADEASSILSQEWYFMNVVFRRALENHRNAVAIRMPKPDATLTLEAFAGELGHYAESARELNGSFYVYEYSYLRDRDLRELQDVLDQAEADNVRIIAAPLLCLKDAEDFITRQLNMCSRQLDEAALAEVRVILGQLRDPGGDGLDIHIQGFSQVMHRAFMKYEADGNGGSLAAYIKSEYPTRNQRREDDHE